MNRPRTLRRAISAKGFTLVEMLAVLTLTALIAGLVLPAMQRWFDSVSHRAELSEVAVQFQRLAARAALLSQTVELNKVTWKDKLSDGEPALALPEGWSVASDKPVVFFRSGTCGGGDVDLVGPKNRKVQLRVTEVTCDVNIVAS